MAAVLMSAGASGKRFALPYARFLLHQVMGGVQGQATDIDIQAREILKLDPRRDDGEPARVAATFVDPAGNAANLATGISTTSQLAGYGIVCQARATSIESGLELIRSKLQPAVGGTSLFIHPQCRGLIDAFGAYRLRSPGEAEALKEGPDHWIDALRYGLTGSHRYPTQTRRYG